MPEYTYINVSNTLFPAFLTFGSMTMHLHCTKLLQDPGLT